MFFFLIKIKGIDPMITNETGLNVNTIMEDLKSFVPKAAVKNAPKDSLHKVSYSDKVKPGKASECKIAFPNDRSRSIGSFNRNKKYK
jgi:hypothetical protein